MNTDKKQPNKTVVFTESERAEALVCIREQLTWSQETLAGCLLIEPRRLAELESGQQRISVRFLKRVLSVREEAMRLEPSLRRRGVKGFGRLYVHGGKIYGSCKS